ncbi:putative carbohydrate-binding protein with starch-binding CBM53 [Orenia metallireducens]|jgi:hypothetical protein|uniref:Starch/carbohydrate-binding module (Family 53) n=1 Tax=Orenia metallireducens TaxID=1413210 RepID=A0A285F7G9_9FIRM|nr:carbohydrate-binding protein [Orenia metallireducens]PRX34908.1 putative carbohydrate-binding protein with starch-binding CBM53 [Orenia metallireducens]SNY06151.1 Starch/carbohydrate-binding module (family 53) [Orenia metallireducens]
MEEIRIEPFPVKAGQRVRVGYNGLLAKSGANQVYLHAGLSRHGDIWEQAKDIVMDNNIDTWTAELEVPTEFEKFNFCFKDCADNWDNNNGKNWTYTIVHGQGLV